MSQTQALLNRLREAVLAGVYDSDLADSILELSSPPSSLTLSISSSSSATLHNAASSELPTQALDKLHQIISSLSPALLTPSQLLAATSFLLRFSSYLSDSNKLTPWLSFLNLLLARSHEPNIENVAQALFLELAQHFPIICDFVLQRYLTLAQPNTPSSEMHLEKVILTHFQHNQPRVRHTITNFFPFIHPVSNGIFRNSLDP